MERVKLCGGHVCPVCAKRVDVLWKSLMLNHCPLKNKWLEENYWIYNMLRSKNICSFKKGYLKFLHCIIWKFDCCKCYLYLNTNSIFRNWHDTGFRHVLYIFYETSWLQRTDTRVHEVNVKILIKNSSFLAIQYSI